MKKIFLILGILVLCASTLMAGSDYYVGSKRSNKYHTPECPMVKRIYPSNKVIFYSIAQAIKSGYIPCRICKPSTTEER